VPPVPFEPRFVPSLYKGTNAEDGDPADKFTWELGDIVIFKKGEKRAPIYGWSLEIKGVPAEASKGGPGSGNWAHEGLDGRHGGSDPGGGIGNLGLEADSTVSERREVAETLSAWRPIGYRPQVGYMESARKQARDNIAKTAEQLGISPEDVVDKIEGDLDYILKSSPISIRRTWKGASGVLEDGRFKTQFETGRSGGAFSPPFRRDAEFKGLGATNSLPDQKRPVYAYVATDAHHADSYGAVEFVLKENVKDRTTITFGDSLGRMHSSSLVGSPMRAPGIEAWDWETFHVYKGDWGYMGYLEAQVHGGVSLVDVEKMIFHAGTFYSGDTMAGEYAGLFERAQELGLKIEIDKETR